MYVDNSQKNLIVNTTDKDGNSIKDIHAMAYSEALAITGSTSITTGIRNTDSYYWLGSDEADDLWEMDNSYRNNCFHEFCEKTTPWFF